jgi:exodeoxyribonuclease-5
MTLSDDKQRLRALTDHQSSLLVEAGAGSGKTALLAGRILMLLGAGVPPGEIAAITFTELAASDLVVRVQKFLDEMMEGKIPPPLALALSGGITNEQEKNLVDAQSRMDELTCSTIHGFCQRLVKPYPVEADIDPGARVMDEMEAAISYDLLFEDWLRNRLNAATDGDPLAEPIASLTPEKGIKFLRGMAKFFYSHRSVRAAKAVPIRPLYEDFKRAVQGFRKWFDGIQRERGICEADTADYLDGFDALLKRFEGLDSDPVPFSMLWASTSPPAVSAMKKDSYEFKKYRVKGKWQGAARAVGLSAAEAERFNSEGQRHYERVGESFQALMNGLVENAVEQLALCFQELNSAYADFKRQRALLDFDDLLYRARDLLGSNPAVRAALSKRYRYMLVDEFQDTDPIQTEILFLLCGEGKETENWIQRPLRQGAVFIVGDPKQSIYRFRRADIRTYAKTRSQIETLFPGNKIEVVSNFRSASPIINQVNQWFEGLLAEDQGQPGFSPLSATIDSAAHLLPPVAAIDVRIEGLPPDEKVKSRPAREAEAKVVADLCRRLIGNLQVRDRDEGNRPCRPGDIALLAPTSTELWIFERALEQRGIPIATQAGKNFYLRQEVQDMIAVARVLADAGDTLAFGALMRGPLVGLTEEELLDIISGLQSSSGSSDYLPKFSLRTDPDEVTHPVAKETLRILQGLGRRALGLPPFDLLNAAVEELRVRPILRQRHPYHAERALANVDLFLEMSRPYAAASLRVFANAVTDSWKDKDREIEGRIDAESEAVQMITIHSAKGLEWPVVIPINTTTKPVKRHDILHHRDDDTLHMKIGDFVPRQYKAVKEEEERQEEQERIRLAYVACTRAMDLLVLPRHARLPADTWIAEVGLPFGHLPALDLAGFEEKPLPVKTEPANQQTRQVFSAEARTIVQRTQKIQWHQPSRHEKGANAVPFPEPPEDESTELVRPSLAGGQLRGKVLHKMMEETLTGELKPEHEQLEARGHELILQLGAEPASDSATGPSPAEMGDTILRALEIPLVKQYRDRLVPEYTVFAGSTEENRVSAVAGIADAVVFGEAGKVELVIDWKSDIAPNAATRAEYRDQIREYITSLNCPKAFIVYMTSGQMEEVKNN